MKTWFSLALTFRSKLALASFPSPPPWLVAGSPRCRAPPEAFAGASKGNRAHGCDRRSKTDCCRELSGAELSQVCATFAVEDAIATRPPPWAPALPSILANCIALA